MDMGTVLKYITDILCIPRKQLLYNISVCIESLITGESKAKSKAVPLHTLVAFGGRGGIAPTHS
jgi:hypothetical protein